MSPATIVALILLIVAVIVVTAVAALLAARRCDRAWRGAHDHAWWLDSAPCPCGACQAIAGGYDVSTPPPDESTPADVAALNRAQFDAIMRREYGR